jgi:hypothetical protein
MLIVSRKADEQNGGWQPCFCSKREVEKCGSLRRTGVKDVDARSMERAIGGSESEDCWRKANSEPSGCEVRERFGHVQDAGSVTDAGTGRLVVWHYSEMSVSCPCVRQQR